MKGMADARLRQSIALEAARLMYERIESEYFTAKRKAARRLCGRNVKPADLPSNAEIRDQIQLYARLHEGDKRLELLKEMRLEALWLMRIIRQFRPRLIGSVMTGHIRKGSDIDIHVFCDSPGLITDLLSQNALQFDVERKQVVKHGESRVFTHIHLFGRHQFELTVYPENKAHYVFRSSITGKGIERASIRELEELMQREYPNINLEEDATETVTDPYPYFRMLLLPLENVRQNPQYHPEGDALYHSLQVFELAKEERPWDEEFLLAALLHDIGKGIDPFNHVEAGLSALDGLITERTSYFIEHHMNAHQYLEGKMDRELLQAMQQSPDFDDLLLLRELDDQGRVPGVTVCTVDEALTFLRELERENAG